MIGVSWPILRIPGGREQYLYLEPTFVARIAAYLSLSALLVCALPRVAERPFSHLGVRAASFGGLALGIAAGVALIAVAFANEALFQTFTGARADGGSELFDDVNAKLVVPTHGVLTVAIASVVEEHFFRGFC